MKLNRLTPLGLLAGGPGGLAGGPEGYRLVWADEFDGNYARYYESVKL